MVASNAGDPPYIRRLLNGFIEPPNCSAAHPYDCHRQQTASNRRDEMGHKDDQRVNQIIDGVVGPGDDVGPERRSSQ
jgi:hypothetical protein